MSLGRILIVDDEEDIRKSVKFLLTKAGYEVVEAPDGEAGVQAIKSGDNPLLVNAIICDMQMPNVNVMEAIGFFRQQFPMVPVIVMTGHPDEDLRKDALLLGAQELLGKPLVLAEVEKILRRVLNQESRT